MKAIVVVPTTREKHIKVFLDRWNDGKREFIVVEDHNNKIFDVADANVDHYSHADIDRDLGEHSWIVPKKTDCVRSYGIWKAWQRKPDMIVTMDDDCLPPDNMPEVWHFYADHWKHLKSWLELPGWQSTIGGVKARGEPYLTLNRKWPCAVSHGLWEGVPDMDAVWQLGVRDQHDRVELLDRVIPAGRYFAMCGMNLAFRAEIAPLMYFGLQGRSYPYDRFGDIWCGVLLKKVLDRFHLAVHSGKPHVHHARASDVWENLRKEQPGYEVNEKFWQAVDGVTLTKETPLDCWIELCEKLLLAGAYWRKLRAAQLQWAELFR